MTADKKGSRRGSVQPSSCVFPNQVEENSQRPPRSHGRRRGGDAVSLGAPFRPDVSAFRILAVWLEHCLLPGKPIGLPITLEWIGPFRNRHTGVFLASPSRFFSSHSPASTRAAIIRGSFTPSCLQIPHCSSVGMATAAGEKASRSIDVGGAGRGFEGSHNTETGLPRSRRTLQPGGARAPRWGRGLGRAWKEVGL